jgi:hypothetical protein
LALRYALAFPGLPTISAGDPSRSSNASPDGYDAAVAKLEQKWALEHSTTVSSASERRKLIAGFMRRRRHLKLLTHNLRDRLSVDIYGQHKVSSLGYFIPASRRRCGSAHLQFPPRHAMRLVKRRRSRRHRQRPEKRREETTTCGFPSPPLRHDHADGERFEFFKPSLSRWSAVAAFP